MNKYLVTYFSATGNTKKLAESLAESIDATLIEIEPAQKYTQQDLDWNDKNSRSTKEMNDENSRPAIAQKLDTIADYNVVFIGFPIWWYTAPRIINTFLESHDFSNKTVIPFATSGSSEIGDISDDLKKSCSPNTIFKKGKRFGTYDIDSLKKWVESLNL